MTNISCLIYNKIVETFTYRIIAKILAEGCSAGLLREAYVMTLLPQKMQEVLCCSLHFFLYGFYILVLALLRYFFIFLDFKVLPSSIIFQCEILN